MFQQVEEPGIYLLTAHWESVDEHHRWQASEESGVVFGCLKDHFLWEKTTFFYLEDSAIFAPSTAGADTSLLHSPVISVGRWVVASQNRAAFAGKRETVQGLLDAFAKPYSVKGGWRMEEQDRDQEFVVACGWPTVEGHGEFATTEDFGAYSSALKGFAKGFDIQHYHRVL